MCFYYCHQSKKQKMDASTSTESASDIASSVIDEVKTTV